MSGVFRYENMEIDVVILSTILGLVALIELILGIYILRRNPKSDINISYSLLVFSAMLWVLANVIAIIIESSTSLLFWAKVSYWAGVLFPALFLYFSWVFPFKTARVSSIKKLVVILPAIIFLVLLFTNTLITSVKIEGSGLSNNLIVEFGKLYNVYVLYFLGYWIWALVNYISKYKSSDGIHRWQLKYLLWGIIISSIFGIIIDLILPWFDIWVYSWIACLFSVVWISFTTYVIFGRR